MPILAKEEDLHPRDLFERPNLGSEPDATWWALYTLSRREKELVRRLVRLDIPCYCPSIAKRNRSPSGRIRVAHIPLFSNYVFLYGDEHARYGALTTNCVSRALKVADGAALTFDLKQIRRLTETGVPITPEAKLLPGDPVKIRSGPFAGFVGVVVRREKEMRLVVAVDFLQQGASVTLDDVDVEPLT